MVNIRKFPIIGRIFNFYDTLKLSLFNKNNLKHKPLVESFFDWYLDIFINGFLLWLPLRFLFQINIPFLFFPLLGVSRYVFIDVFDETVIKSIKEYKKK
jgi:hypothetical protein